MTTLEERRAAWDAAEIIRKRFFVNGTSYPDPEALAAHERERRVLTLAEALQTDGHFGAAAHGIGVPADVNELVAARALAGVAQ